LRSRKRKEEPKRTKRRERKRTEESGKEQKRTEKNRKEQKSGNIFPKRKKAVVAVAITAFLCYTHISLNLP